MENRSRKRLGSQKMSEEEYVDMNDEMIRQGYSQGLISAFWYDWIQRDKKPAPPGKMVELARELEENMERLKQSYGLEISPAYEQAALALIEDFNRQRLEVESTMRSDMSELDTQEKKLPPVDKSLFRDREHHISEMIRQGYYDEEELNGGRFKKSRIQNRKRKTMKSKKKN
jgi:hypothetical protein